MLNDSNGQIIDQWSLSEDQKQRQWIFVCFLTAQMCWLHSWLKCDHCVLSPDHSLLFLLCRAALDQLGSGWSCRRTQNPNGYDDCNVCRCRWHWTTSVKLDLDLLSQMFYIGFRAVSHADTSSRPERHCHTTLTYSIFVWASWQGQRRQWIVLKNLSFFEIVRNRQRPRTLV